MAAPDLDAAVSITRGADPMLVLGDAPYVLVDLAPPARRWRRATVEGRYQHGRALVGSVLEQATIRLEVRVEAASWAALDTALTTLLAAVSQRSYETRITIGSTTDRWRCEPADVDYSGGALEKHLAMSAMQSYILTIPAYPVEVSS